MGRRVKVKLTPIGNAFIRCHVYGKIICSRPDNPGVIYSNNATLPWTDSNFIRFFGSRPLVRSFMSKGRPVHKVVSLDDIDSFSWHFHGCERVV